jgi:hypothetical protein
MPVETKIYGAISNRPELTAYICNACRVRVDANDPFEVQEMLVWQNMCGYGSVFGDGAHIQLILCQDCVKDLLGKYIDTIEEL